MVDKILRTIVDHLRIQLGARNQNSRGKPLCLCRVRFAQRTFKGHNASVRFYKMDYIPFASSRTVACGDETPEQRRPRGSGVRCMESITYSDVNERTL